MICPNCGTNNAEGVAFCANCGAAMQAAPVQPVQPMKNPGKGLGVAALVLGIIAQIILPMILGALALILGAVGMSKSKAVGMKNGMAVAGVVLGIIGLAWWVLRLIICGGCALIG